MAEEEKKVEEGVISIKKSDIWKYSTFFLIAIVLIGAFFLLKGNSGGTGNTINTRTDQESDIVRASIDNDAILGDRNAPVTIIEFSDFQCPFCRKFWTETYPLIKSQYVDSGKVRIVIRDLPLTSIHPMAQTSAEAAECVREKGGDKAYFDYRDKIFSEQNILDSGSPNGPVTKTITYTTADLKKWAQELGYDISSCLDSSKYKSEVQADLSAAISSGIQGTPSFVILKTGDSEGVALRGAYPFDSFKQVIESLL
ncbi:MAG: DsbA family protein [Candidatus Pacearchaeota archaeon]